MAAAHRMRNCIVRAEPLGHNRLAPGQASDPNVQPALEALLGDTKERQPEASDLSVHRRRVFAASTSAAGIGRVGEAVPFRGCNIGGLAPNSAES